MTNEANEVSEPEDQGVDDSKITCWCGVVGTASELFDDDVYSQNCGGTGYLVCECGGESCVCHHHGQVECPGCEDCDDTDYDWYDDGYCPHCDGIGEGPCVCDDDVR